MQHLEFIIALP